LQQSSDMRLLKASIEAMSPVIGTALLVAIAVTLAASVFFFVSRLTDTETEKGPDIGFSKDEDTDTIMVAQAEDGLDWSTDFVFRGSCSPTLNGAAFPTGPGHEVAAGDLLGCAPGEDITVASSENMGDALLFETAFV
jgi:flagellin-like protein